MRQEISAIVIAQVLINRSYHDNNNRKKDSSPQQHKSNFTHSFTGKGASDTPLHNKN